MRHLFRLWLTILLIPAMAIPALATLDIGGSVAMDVYYYHQDKEGFANPAIYLLPAGSGYPIRTTPGSGGMAGLPVGATTNEKDREQTYFDLNRSSHLRFTWTSEAGVGMYITPFFNADPRQQTDEDGFNVGICNIVGWWDITPKLRLIAGKGGYEEIFSPDSPGTTMGYDGVAKVIGLGYGNVDSKYQNGVRFTYKFSSAVSAKLGILESRLLNPDASYYNPPADAANTVVDNVTVIPKFELGVPMTFLLGNNLLLVTPSGMYIQQKYDNVAEGADDSITAYGLALGVKAVFSKFTFKAEYNYGQNLNDAGRAGVCTSFPFKLEYAATIGSIQYAKTDAAGKVYDSTTNAGWVELEFKLGKFKPSLFYGRQEMQRDMPTVTYMGYVVQGDSKVTTQFYGINCDIDLVKNFILTPEIMMYDDGEGKWNGVEYKFGKELLIGTQLRWIF